MATAAAFFVLLALPVAAHSPLGSNGERFRGNSRKLWDLAAQENHIWGRCDEWDAKVSGCHLNSQNKCSDRLSAGPATYDLEITLGNLTPSTAEREVHLAWWAPRKSQTNWNPVENLQGCAVYRSMRSAYPDFNDPDFNGGNLKVSESGEVVIRMQSPATYFVTSWISVPHIHLRLCSNDTFAHTTQDAIVFAKNGAELVAGEAGSTLQIRNIQNFSYWPNPGSGNVSDRNIVGFLVWKKQQDGSVTTTASPGQLVEEIIDDEMANFNWDALEFSPIYQCFTNQQLFDHFTATCVDQCSDSAEVARGQCVRRGNKPEVQAVATWDLAVTCNEACWAEWKNKTLHYTRLAVADLLDIPFQEVEKAAIAFGASGGRRLSTEREATVQVLIKTKRLSITEINTLTPLLFANTATATEIMNFPVSSATLKRLSNDGQWPTMPTGADMVDNANDPYEGAYDQKEPRGGFQTIGGIPTGDLPLGLIVGIAVAVVVGGFGFGFCVFWRRRPITESRNGNIVTAAGTIIGSGSPMTGKKVEDSGVPTTGNHTAQELARKAEDAW